MTDEPRRPDVAQEEDRVDARKAWLWTGATVVVTVLLCGAAWLLLRALDPAGAAPPRDVLPEGAAPPDAPAAATPRLRGQPFGAKVQKGDTTRVDSGGSWAWIDREAGLARVPVDAAMELLVEMEGGADATDAARPRRAAPDTVSPDTLATGMASADTLAPGTAASSRRHPTLSRVDVEPRTGASLPLELTFTDALGRTAPLGAAFAGERPVLVVPGWYRCRMLCGTVADGLADAVAEMEARTDLRAGRDFAVVALGIDPREGPADARERRERVRRRLGAPAELPGWTFLTGPDGAARRVADSLGFRYAWDEATDQYAHAAAVFAVSPTGTVTGALWGVSFDPAEVETALERAAAERPGLSLEKVLVRCFRYTPALQRHAGVIAGVLKGGGALILLGLAGVFVLAGRKAARREPA